MAVCTRLSRLSIAAVLRYRRSLCPPLTGRIPHLAPLVGEAPGGGRGTADANAASAPLSPLSVPAGLRAGWRTHGADSTDSGRTHARSHARTHGRTHAPCFVTILAWLRSSKLQVIDTGPLATKFLFSNAMQPIYISILRLEFRLGSDL